MSFFSLSVIVFYIKYFDCTVNSSQSSQLYRTSRSNAFFISILLISFIVTIIPVGYSIAEIKPSIACGPFRGLPTIWSEMVHVISGKLCGLEGVGLHTYIQTYIWCTSEGFDACLNVQIIWNFIS